MGMVWRHGGAGHPVIIGPVDVAKGLNEAQREAVLRGDGPVLVLAGAGSGKTRVLTRRVAHLISSGVPPWRIIALTFTNKAAHEMQSRVASFTDGRAGELWVSTFHSACVRLLRPHAELLGYTGHFTVIDGDDQRALARACLKDLQISDRRFPPGAMLASISRWKNEGADPNAAAAGARDFFEHEAARVYRAYQSRLMQSNAVDFDDLLVLVVRLFREQRDVAERYAERFQHVLVDEYQDTNRAQYEIVHALSARHRNLFVVGDADQSVYGWRGADIRNILDFERDFPDARIIKLEQNYRSTQRILDAAGAVIRHNKERRERDLWSDLGRGEPVRFFCGFDERAEADFVVNEIRQLAARDGRSANDFAVLYRTHAQSRVLEEAFLARGVPYHIVGGVKFYERKEIKDALAYLRLAANPYDQVSFERIANVPRRGLGPSTVRKVLDAARTGPVFETLADPASLPGVTRAQAARLAELGRLLRRLHDRAPRAPVAELVRDLIEESGYRDELLAEADPRDLSRLENLEELVNVASAFPAKPDGTQLDDFLAEAALVSEADAYDETRPAVTFLTLHSAKGLEFPVVFLVGMEERIFPHSRSIEEDTVEEERRLCYVGMTRAKERLYLTCARRRMLYGDTELREPSRFLAEVGADGLEPVDGSAPLDSWSNAVGAGGRQAAAFVHRTDADASLGEPSTWLPGDRVRHALWGAGTVVAVRGQGGEAEVTVAFQGAGVRRLLVRYAKLEPA